MSEHEQIVSSCSVLIITTRLLMLLLLRHVFNSKRFISGKQGSYIHSNAFFKTFQDLQRPNSRVFQDSNILFFQNFSGNVPFKTLVARGQKVHIQNRLLVYLYLSKDAKMLIIFLIIGLTQEVALY